MYVGTLESDGIVVMHLPFSLKAEDVGEVVALTGTMDIGEVLE